MCARAMCVRVCVRVCVCARARMCVCRAGGIMRSHNFDREGGVCVRVCVCVV